LIIELVATTRILRVSSNRRRCLPAIAATMMTVRAVRLRGSILPAHGGNTLNIAALFAPEWGLLLAVEPPRTATLLFLSSFASFRSS